MGGATGKVVAWDLKANRLNDIGSHDSPVKDVFHIPDMSNSVVSAGWDGFIKFWDCRSPSPICS